MACKGLIISKFLEKNLKMYLKFPEEFGHVFNRKQAAAWYLLSKK